MEDLIRSYFRLINEEKFDEFFALFDPDVEFSAPFGFHVKGVEKLKPFYLNVPNNFPEHGLYPDSHGFARILTQKTRAPRRANIDRVTGPPAAHAPYS